MQILNHPEEILNSPEEILNPAEEILNPRSRPPMVTPTEDTSDASVTLLSVACEARPGVDVPPAHGLKTKDGLPEGCRILVEGDVRQACERGRPWCPCRRLAARSAR